jgi:hypothetical protein
MSEIRAATVSNLAGTGPVTLTGQFAAKAWVNFNGTGTVAIRQSGNVSSITDNGTGDYTINFSNAFGAADYSMVASGRELPAFVPTAGIFSASSFTVRTVNTSFVAADSNVVSATNDGDLA